MSADDARNRALDAVRTACPPSQAPGEGGDSSSDPLVESPQLVQAISGSYNAVEHRLAVRDFDHPSGYGAMTDGLR